MIGTVPQVAVLDYGSGNLHSVTRALRAAGAEVTVTADPTAALGADGLVVPGVGAYAACMAQLRAIGGERILRSRVDAGRPVFGICVGHQILFAGGAEHGVETAGVGVFPGRIDRLPAKRLPHMGWNTVEAPIGSRLFAGVGNERFYFVHSYAALAPESVPAGAKVTWCTHEDVRFIAAVEWGPVASTQFHPEKSGQAGGRLLRTWLASL